MVQRMDERESVAVREVTSEDVPAVIELVTQVLGEFGIAFGRGSATDAELVGLPDVYRDAGGAFWVACDRGGRLVGTAGVFPLEVRGESAATIFELRKMYLAKEARGLGVGKRLLERAIDFCRGVGAQAIVLDTTDQMKQAIAFYERHGFVRDDTQIRGSRCSRGYRLALTRC